MNLLEQLQAKTKRSNSDAGLYAASDMNFDSYDDGYDSSGFGDDGGDYDARIHNEGLRTKLHVDNFGPRPDNIPFFCLANDGISAFSPKESISAVAKILGHDLPPIAIDSVVPTTQAEFKSFVLRIADQDHAFGYVCGFYDATSASMYTEVGGSPIDFLFEFESVDCEVCILVDLQVSENDLARSIDQLRERLIIADRMDIAIRLNPVGPIPVPPAQRKAASPLAQSAVKGIRNHAANSNWIVTSESLLKYLSFQSTNVLIKSTFETPLAHCRRIVLSFAGHSDSSNEMNLFRRRAEDVRRTLVGYNYQKPSEYKPGARPLDTIVLPPTSPVVNRWMAKLKGSLRVSDILFIYATGLVEDVAAGVSSTKQLRLAQGHLEFDSLVRWATRTGAGNIVILLDVPYSDAVSINIDNARAAGINLIIMGVSTDGPTPAPGEDNCFGVFAEEVVDVLDSNDAWQTGVLTPDSFLEELERKVKLRIPDCYFFVEATGDGHINLAGDMPHFRDPNAVGVGYESREGGRIRSISMSSSHSDDSTSSSSSDGGGALYGSHAHHHHRQAQYGGSGYGGASDSGGGVGGSDRREADRAARVERLRAARRHRVVDDTQNPLFVAAIESGDTPGAVRLYKAGANAAACRTSDGETILVAAAAVGMGPIVALLLHDTDNEPNMLQRNLALKAAVAGGQNATASLLIKAGANPSQTENKTTLLMTAAAEGNTPLVTLLAKRGCPLEKRNTVGMSALLMAVEGGHRSTVSALLRAGAKTSFPNRSGVSALELARNNGYVDIALMLERAG